MAATDDTFATFLRCPQTRQPLRPIDSAKLDELNESIRSGALKNEAGVLVDQTLDSALIREDDTIVYPIRDGVPNLLIADRILI
jgi:uncharacterized protein YbaR (Trm112 family)